MSESSYPLSSCDNALGSSSASTACSSRSESSWTPYIVDFLIHNNDWNREIITTSCASSGPLDDDNDAVAGVEISKNDKRNVVQVQDAGGSRLIKRISNLRKRKAKEDEALEDTASSPNHSPKVCGVRRLDICPKNSGEHHPAMEKARDILEPVIKVIEKDEVHDETRSKTQMCDDKNRGITELKRKGLRLVPLSSVVLTYPQLR